MVEHARGESATRRTPAQLRASIVGVLASVVRWAGLVVVLILVIRVLLTVGGANNLTSTFSGVISGLGGLTKAGAGALTLSNNQLYTGATTISAGTLNQAGTFANTAIAVSGGTLSLQGAGAVTQQGESARRAIHD